MTKQKYPIKIGSIIKAHKNEPEQVVKVIRDWFKLTTPEIPRYKVISLAYNEFEFDNEQVLLEEGYDPKDIDSLTFSDIIENMTAWIKIYR